MLSFLNLFSLFRIIRVCLFVSILFCSFACGLFFFFMNNRCINFSVLENYNPGCPSIVLDDEGKEWTRFQLDRREPIKLEQMPDYLIQAFITAEDRDFFNHIGISFKGIIRSSFVNLYHRRIVQGASTITQQLVKLLFFDTQKTFKRKLKEQLFALLVEQQFTKEQILETYFNHVYFGFGIYGVEAASQRFWAKHTHELTLAQAALLASIVRSPANYCPILYPLSAQKRRNLILHLMLVRGVIDKQEYQYAIAEDTAVIESAEEQHAPHLKESLRLFLEELFGKEKLYTGGLIIQTTVNSNMQKEAEKQFRKYVDQMHTKISEKIDGALLAIDVKTGEIRALVGGADFQVSKFNRALQAKRQLGSTFKPVVYAAAVEAGFSFADIEIDEPLELIQSNGVWNPHNVTDTHEGKMTLAYALSRSNNIVAIKTFLRVGTEPIIALAKKLHLEGPFHHYPSLALGTIEATVKEAVGMFNVFANNGVYIEPHYVKWVKDRWGKKIWRVKPERSVVLSSRVSGQVAKVLRIGIERIHKLLYQKLWIDSEAISKTGTTNDWRTCWFIGSTPTLTTAIYIGCDDNRPMGEHVYPVHTALPIWKDFNRALSAEQKTFSFDSSLKEVYVHEKTGQIIAKDTPAAIPIYLCSRS
ncbi:PBP1A family penicillin-binding protein [Candidatus Dependentiae bacterium]|nr:MAG: PBP1A family penicillin-binding protein [Candidatus Dependentiae bacterium]